MTSVKVIFLTYSHSASLQSRHCLQPTHKAVPLLTPASHFYPDFQLLVDKRKKIATCVDHI